MRISINLKREKNVLREEKLQPNNVGRPDTGSSLDGLDLFSDWDLEWEQVRFLFLSIWKNNISFS